MTLTAWISILVVCLTVVALLKKVEARLVLLAAGFFMAFVSLDPMEAFRQFDKSMTNGSIIISVCSAMGFAAVISYTQCDIHLVTLLIKPLRKLGWVLLPACMIICHLLFTAIPTLAGLGAAIGPTLIPILVRAGFSPTCAVACIVGSSLGGYFNPGLSHNSFISSIASMTPMQFVLAHIGMTITICALLTVFVCLTCFFMGDYKKPSDTTSAGNQELDGVKPNLLYAIAPLLPIIILVISTLYFPEKKISVATSMLFGTIYTFAVTRKSPQQGVEKFFNGMGKGYANILGIIIAAGVFAAGLRAAGIIDSFVNFLTHSNEIARIGGSIGPYLLGVLTGSGDAATFAFNEAVTPHAPQFGMTIDGLGYLAMVAAALGRMSSPLAGGVILLAGMAGVSPIDVVKRTIPAALILLVFAYFVA